MGDVNKVTCWNCGAESADAEWCDVCGSELHGDATNPQAWLQAGQAACFELDGQDCYARIVEVLESFATRRIVEARLCPPGQEEEHFTAHELLGDSDAPPPDRDSGLRPFEAEWEVLVLDESVTDDSMQPTILVDQVRALVHTPITTFNRGPSRRVEVLRDPPGAPLREYLESLGRLLTLEEAAGVALLLMDAVEKVHRAGLYHFQICPWTIRISHVGDEPEDGHPDPREPDEPLRLTFEGLKGFYSARAEVESHPVITGFSPPEFFGRSNGDIDQRVDVFGVGMLFYYLLAGTTPPTGSLTRHVPYLPMRAFRFELPPGLQPFVDGCTAPEPDDRFLTIGLARTALLEALDVAQRRKVSTEAPSEGPRVSLYCAVDRHIGIGKGRRYPINQDAVFLGHDPTRGIALIAVADGVSTASYGSGDVASAFLVESAHQHWTHRHVFATERYPSALAQNADKGEGEDAWNDDSVEGRVPVASHRQAASPESRATRLLDHVLDAANIQISAYINEHHSPFVGPVHEVMGTTGLLAFFEDDLVTMASLGDSRIYLLRDGHMERLTKDHNLATLHMLEGFPADEALTMPHGKALARCLGTFQVRNGDLAAIAPEPDAFAFRVLPGDTILMTTDGLVDFGGPTESASERNIQATLESEEIPSLACLRLIMLANEGGGEDNIGLAVIRVTRHHDSSDRLTLTQTFPPPR